MRVCYGGTFDPVHNGHLAIARAARDQLDAKVFLMPARDPPHKAGTRADAGQRAAMLELAIEGEPGLAVDRRELDRAGPSYTVDTLAALRAELGPDAPIAWLIGADSLRQLHTWHHWRELFQRAHLLVVERPGADIAPDPLRDVAPEVAGETHRRLCAPAALAQAPAGGIALLPMPALRPESSTELRRRIRAGEPWKAWLPAPVAAYVVRHELYRDPAGILAPPSPSLRP
ncbi:MAG: nicotinate-nucleotide adenylyltransferase [Lysobacteraceae bacterium]|nr:MAG: nicotinate-nucleotide adenylyltransferase [Xanthomonadaceae bacterium]